MFIRRITLGRTSESERYVKAKGFKDGQEISELKSMLGLFPELFFQ